VLRLQRLSADLEFRGRAEADHGDLHATCEAVQEELVRVDRDIADRYFAGALGTLLAADDARRPHSAGLDAPRR
jgi:hypothetical protein